MQKTLTICDSSKGQVPTQGYFDLISGFIIREPAWHIDAEKCASTYQYAKKHTNFFPNDQLGFRTFNVRLLFQDWYVHWQEPYQ